MCASGEIDDLAEKVNKLKQDYSVEMAGVMVKIARNRKGIGSN